MPNRSRDPFVGRKALMRALSQRLARAGGSENISVLAGEAGIGKTRTARELAAQARRANLRVWFGSAYEGVVTPPYWPWIQILRESSEDLSETTWQSLLPPGTGAIAQLVPELFRGSSPAPSLEPQVARFRLFEEISRFLRSASERTPLLLIIDDVQCADLGSLELLRFAARALQDLPVTFVVTLRKGGLESPDQQHVIDQLGRAATVFTLDALTREEVSELTLAIAGDTLLDDRAGTLLYERTQGNPLFVRQSVELIQQHGQSAFLQSAHAGALPPAVQHVIRQRLEGLAAETQRALAGAAVVGKSFDASLLAEILELPQGGVLDALEQALRSGVLERQAGTLTEFRFAHVLSRDSLYEDLSLRERGLLHGRIARALSRRAEGMRSRELGAIAHHYLHAVPFEAGPAIDACRKAASVAQEASGFEAAADLLTRAIHKLETEGGDAETRFRLRLELGEDHFYAGLVASAWQAFRDAADTARLGCRNDLLAEAAPRLADCLELGVGDLQLARGVVELALGSPENQGPAVLATLLAQRAELALDLSGEARFEILDRAAALADQSLDVSAILEVAHSRAILRDPTQLPENLQAAEQFLLLLERHADHAASMRYRSLRRFGAHMTRYLYALTNCDLEAADRALEQCDYIAQVSHVRAARFGTDLMRAGRALGDGRLEELRQMIPPFWQRSTVELPTELHAWANYFSALLQAQGNLHGDLRAEPRCLRRQGPASHQAQRVLRHRARSHLLVARPARRGACDPRADSHVGARPDATAVRRPFRDVRAGRGLSRPGRSEYSSLAVRSPVAIRRAQRRGAQLRVPGSGRPFSGSPGADAWRPRRSKGSLSTSDRSEPRACHASAAHPQQECARRLLTQANDSSPPTHRDPLSSKCKTCPDESTVTARHH